MTPSLSRQSWQAADVGGSRLHLPHGTTPALDSAMWVLALAIVAMLNIEAGSMPTVRSLGNRTWLLDSSVRATVAVSNQKVHEVRSTRRARLSRGRKSSSSPRVSSSGMTGERDLDRSATVTRHGG